MTEKDLDLLDRSLFEALPLMATTRSKIGQMPRLYLRVEYKDPYIFLGDFREHLKLSREEGLESIRDVSLEYQDFIDRLNAAKVHIERILFQVHPSFTSGMQLLNDIRETLGLELQEIQPLVS